MSGSAKSLIEFWEPSPKYRKLDRFVDISVFSKVLLSVG